MSVPASKSTRTVALPSWELEITRFTRSRKRTSGSIAWTMVLSTSSAPAPGQATVTMTVSMPKSGKNCLFMRESASRPITIMAAISRFAAVGWRANSEIKGR